MTNALFTATTYYPSIGGAQLHWFKINQILSQRGHNISAFSQWQDTKINWLIDSTILTPKLDEKNEVNGIRIYNKAPSNLERLKMSFFLPTYYLFPEFSVPPIGRIFTNIIDKIDEEFDFVHNIRIGREHLSWASYYLAKKKRVPFFITPNYSPRMQTGLGQFTLRNLFKLLRNADGVFVFTDEEKEEMQRIGVDENKVCVIGIGPLLNETSNREKFLNDYQIDGPVILFLGQKQPYKGFDTLLKSSKIVWEQHPNTHFVFIGPHLGKSKEILSMMQDKRIIDIAGVKPFDELKSSALAAATVFALPSRQEGIGGVYIEAWSYEKPVIACNIPFVREVISHGVDGFLVEQTPEEVSKKILWLLDNPDKANEMGRKGYEKVQKKYNWETIVDKIETFYNQKIHVNKVLK